MTSEEFIKAIEESGLFQKVRPDLALINNAYFFRLLGTDWYLNVKNSKGDLSYCWSNSCHYKLTLKLDFNFEYVLDNVDPKTQQKLIYHMDLFKDV